MSLRRTFAFLVASSACAFAGCSNDPSVNPSGIITNGAEASFTQIDRIGKPGIKELYVVYGSHVGYDNAIPSGDASNYGGAVSGFVTGTGGRSAAIGSFVATMLLPDALIANFNSSATRASYLGWETGGAIGADCNGLPGEAFGGRALTDDVVDVDLGLAFGNLATSAALTSANTTNLGATPPADDGKEKNGSNGTPNLTKQNVSCTAKTNALSGSTFPYLAAPV